MPHDPNRQLFCDARDYSIPFLHEFKVSGSVPLPGGIQVSGSAQFYPAQEAVVGGSLSWGGTHQGGALEGARPYNGNIEYIVPSSVFVDQEHVRTQSFSVPLMPPGALFYDRLTQVDLSVRRTFALANGMRWELQADIYNIIDAQPILNGNNAFGTNGASLGRALSTIQGPLPATRVACPLVAGAAPLTLAEYIHPDTEVESALGLDRTDRRRRPDSIILGFDNPVTVAVPEGCRSQRDDQAARRVGSARPGERRRRWRPSSRLVCEALNRPSRNRCARSSRRRCRPHGMYSLYCSPTALAMTDTCE